MANDNRLEFPHTTPQEMKAALSSQKNGMYLIVTTKSGIFGIVAGRMMKIRQLPNGILFHMNLSTIEERFVRVLFDPTKSANIQFRLADHKLYEIVRGNVVQVK